MLKELLVPKKHVSIRHGKAGCRLREKRKKMHEENSVKNQNERNLKEILDVYTQHTLEKTTTQYWISSVSQYGCREEKKAGRNEGKNEVFEGTQEDIKYEKNWTFAKGQDTHFKAKPEAYSHKSTWPCSAGRQRSVELGSQKHYLHVTSKIYKPSHDCFLQEREGGEWVL